MKETDTHKPLIKLLLETATAISDRGDNDAQAEKVFKKALDFADKEEVKRGYLAFSVLIEMLDFYDERGREEDSERVWEGIVEIVRARYTDIIDPSYG